MLLKIMREMKNFYCLWNGGGGEVCSKHFIIGSHVCRRIDKDLSARIQDLICHPQAIFHNGPIICLSRPICYMLSG